MKIGIVGNCMAAGLGMAFRQIAENAEVLAFEAREVLRADAVETVVKTLCQCDAVFANNLPPEYGSLGFEILKTLHSKVCRIPTGVFTGFHPDCAYFIHEGKQYGSPLGPYNSVIVAAAFSMGLKVDDTLRMFDADVFRRLGYFDEFGKARRFLEQEFNSCGLAVQEEFGRWLERGTFVHTINHPKGFMVAGIAKLMAAKLELVSAALPPPELACDFLSSNTIWPVYPAIAEQIGVSGSYLFKRPGGPDLTGGSGVFYSLREFVGLSFEKYGNIPAAAFNTPTISRVSSILTNK